jgi:predicted metal-binding membrane protein
MTDPKNDPAGPARIRGARVRGILLFLAATILNFLTASILFFGFLALWGLVLAPRLRLPTSSPVIFAAFVLAVAGSGIVYRAAVRVYLRKSGRDPGHLTKS